MPCTVKKTLETARQTGNEIITQVKSNQKFLLEDCRDTALLEPASQTYAGPAEKGRGRIEQRKVEVFGNFSATDAKWDGLIREMIKVSRIRQVFDTKEKDWKSSKEVAYYISTTELTAKEYYLAIRNHWAIENRSNNVRDNALGEDASRIRKNPGIFARLRSFALNTLRTNNVDNIALELYGNSLNINRVLQYEGIN
jgi:predicted transposase YbfD/YdcC